MKKNINQTFKIICLYPSDIKYNSNIFQYCYYRLNNENLDEVKSIFNKLCNQSNLNNIKYWSDVELNILTDDEILNDINKLKNKLNSVLELIKTSS